MNLKHIIIIGALCGALLIPTSAQTWGVIGLSGTGAGGGDTYAVSYRSDSSANVVEGTSVEVTAPESIANGDMILAFVVNDVYGAGTRVETLSGFTLLTHVDYGSDFEFHVFYKEASSESGNYTWSFVGSTDAMVLMVVYSKDGGSWTVPTTSGYFTTAVSGTNAARETTAINTTDRSILVGAWAKDGTGSVSGAPADMTASEFLSASSVACATYYQAYSSAAASVTKTLTWQAADQNSAIAIVLEAR